MWDVKMVRMRFAKAMVTITETLLVACLEFK